MPPLLSCWSIFLSSAFFGFLILDVIANQVRIQTYCIDATFLCPKMVTPTGLLFKVSEFVKNTAVLPSTVPAKLETDTLGGIITSK